MASTPLGLGPLQTGIALTISGLDSAASGTLLISNAFNIPPLASSDADPDVVDLVLQLGSSITLGASPQMSAVLIIARDGTNFEPAYVSNNALFPYYGGVTPPLDPSVVYQTLVCPGIIVPAVLASGNFAKLAFYWNGGVALPVSVTPTLYPSGFSAG